MGRPKFPRKKYDAPLHPWKEDRIKSERELIKKYGLKNNREVWKAKTYLKKYRGQARELSAKIGGKDPQVKKESDQLLLHLTRMSILSAGSGLDDVLALETESILSRRLQTLVYHRGLANTIDHARQLVSHGHIAIGNRKITIPGYMVPKDEENSIGYTNKSPLNTMSHPARPKTDVYKTNIPAKKATEDKKETEEKVEDEKTKEPTTSGKSEEIKKKDVPVESEKESKQTEGEKTEEKKEEVQHSKPDEEPNKEITESKEKPEVVSEDTKEPKQESEQKETKENNENKEKGDK